MSFCDPDDASCVPGVDAEGACEVEEADDVDAPSDLIPTVDDLFALAEDAADGEVGNGQWRTLPPKEDLESHIQFDLQIDTFLGLADKVLDQVVTQALNLKPIKVEIPYTAEGSVFFDIPDLGKKAVGFGPFADTWTLK